MKKQIVEKGANLIKYSDGSAGVLCSSCGEWDEVKAGSKQADLLANWPEKANGWQCNKCWQAEKVIPGSEPRWTDRTDEIRVGQAINLAIAELIVTDPPKSIDARLNWGELVKVRARYYYDLIQEIQEEYHGKN